MLSLKRGTFLLILVLLLALWNKISAKSFKIIICTKQRNIDTLFKSLSKISDPDDDSYGKYYTFDHIGETVQNMESSQVIEAWLNSSGLTTTFKSKYGEYFVASATEAMWSSVLNTRLLSIDHLAQGVTGGVLRVPHDLFLHVDAILFSKGTMVKKQRGRSGRTRQAVSTPHLQAGTTCVGYVDINVLQKAYSINGIAAFANQSIFATIDQSFSAADAAYFQSINNVPSNPIVDVIGGHSNNTICEIDYSQCLEGSLDVQYITSIATSSPTTYWYQPPSNGTELIEWIIRVADDPNPPWVHSISYCGLEVEMNRTLMVIFHKEAMKLGLRGVTIVAASGDQGVSGSFHNLIAFICICYFDFESSFQGGSHVDMFPCGLHLLHT